MSFITRLSSGFPTAELLYSGILYFPCGSTNCLLSDWPHLDYREQVLGPRARHVPVDVLTAAVGNGGFQDHDSVCFQALEAFPGLKEDPFVLAPQVEIASDRDRLKVAGPGVLGGTRRKNRHLRSPQSAGARHAPFANLFAGLGEAVTQGAGLEDLRLVANRRALGNFVRLVETSALAQGCRRLS